jgi:hypothetical protein
VPFAPLQMYAFDYKEPPDEYGDDSDEPPPPSKRRVAKPETRKRDNRHTVAISEKPPCSCRMECYSKIGRQKRKAIRTAFLSMPKRERKTHMRGVFFLLLCPVNTDTLTAPHAAMIDLHQVSFKGKALEVHRKRRPRTFRAEYHLKSPSDHKRVHVCLAAFLGILVDTHCMYAPCRYVL